MYHTNNAEVRFNFNLNPIVKEEKQIMGNRWAKENKQHKGYKMKKPKKIKTIKPLSTKSKNKIKM